MCLNNYSRCVNEVLPLNSDVGGCSPRIQETSGCQAPDVNTILILPTSHSIRSHRWRAQPYITAPTPASGASAYQPDIDFRFPRPPSLGVINLPEGLTELREPLSLPDSETGRWTRCTGQGSGQGLRAPRPSLSHPSPRISACSPARKLSEHFPLGC